MSLSHFISNQKTKKHWCNSSSDLQLGTVSHFCSTSRLKGGGGPHKILKLSGHFTQASLNQQSTAQPWYVHSGAIRGRFSISSYCYSFHNGSEAVRSSSPRLTVRASLFGVLWIGIYINTLARASAPALPMNALDGWKATSYMDSSDFFRWEVTSCTHVLLSRFHSRIEQSWPGQDNTQLVSLEANIGQKASHFHPVHRKCNSS